MTAAIEVTGATVRYGDVLALEDVHLSVRPGRVCGLLGMNGSGKSTLFKAVLGLVPLDRGRVRLLGTDNTAARRRGLVGYVPQSEQVDWAFPVRVRDVVMMGRYGHMGRRRRPRPADREAVDHALARTDLTSLADRQIGALSGGQRKRAFVARAIAQGADVLLLDEPFAGVDKRSEATITDLLLQLRRAGHTLLVSTHDLAQVPVLCDEAVLLQRRVIAHGTPEEVLEPDVLLEAFGIHPSEEGRQWTR
ncbi:ABC transporter [Nocardiopsis terrae]|uniref:Manganese transport system ATP-binding protein n=1 Tax=Nocardiopsis terrae TaxID=372655 RepID=A0ABR9HHF9_9ACTN|nr:metal ABC transporter ATP-binding protein [Nocardiopsis terrae]MBE1458443.1 manganese transport system ATP-binding protein [Nocardiopsis terrae]GHC80446.1 ABC transporter [Nocardiopsis terrae]